LLYVPGVLCILDQTEEIIGVSDQMTCSSDLGLDLPLKPQVQYIVQEYIGEHWTEHASNNLAKHPITLEAVISRVHLRAPYGRGFTGSG
jgi:hypothetical protein